MNTNCEHDETRMQNAVKAYTVALCKIKICQMWNKFCHSLQAMSSQLVQSNHIEVPQVSATSTYKKGKGSPYSITECRVPELIPFLGSQPAGDVSYKPSVTLPLLSAKPTVTLATLRGLLPISLLGEQRHDGCEQFA